ncbi:VTT domain-containing protein [uncultured Shimia sp.]|uniref:DedA family protein n=1 Tax=uncultured Shimia sp. TaxID=573152 RepID=UPI0026372608|nr:VTT domain-containing protein [uncultured Shimia sp.]
MADWLTDALLTYGPLLVGLCTFACCLIVPIPASWLMLAGGALASGGAMSLPLLMIVAFAGAVLGDQTGYFTGVAIHDRVQAFAQRHRRSAQLYRRAQDLTDTRGGPGVFFSRWLLSPLGPYVNLISGAADMTWARFTLWASLGKLVWVGLYCGLGFLFAHNLPKVARLLGGVTWALTGLAIVIVAAAIYWQRRQKTKG